MPRGCGMMPQRSMRSRRSTSRRVRRPVLDLVGYDVPGAEGAADFDPMPTYDPTASVYFEGGQWMIHYDFPPDLTESHAVIETRPRTSRPRRSTRSSIYRRKCRTVGLTGTSTSRRSGASTGPPEPRVDRLKDAVAATPDLLKKDPWARESSHESAQEPRRGTYISRCLRRVRGGASAGTTGRNTRTPTRRTDAAVMIDEIAGNFVRGIQMGRSLVRHEVRPGGELLGSRIE